MANETDLAYAAGIIDGEGCISIYRNTCKTCVIGFRYSLVVRVGMKSKQIPLWLHQSFGGSFHEYINLGFGDSLMYCWSLGSREARDFLLKILPYLRLKKEHAELAIQFQGSKKRVNHKPIALLEAEKVLADKMHWLNRRKGSDE